MSILATPFQILGKFLASKVSATTAKYIVTAWICGSAINKVIPATLAPIQDNWYSLPGWFWTGSAIYELLSLGLLWAGHEELGRTMLYIFLGGAMTAVTILKTKKPTWFLLPLPVLCVGFVASMAYHENRPFSPNDVYALIGGVAFGLAVEQLGNAPAPKGGKKK